MGEYIRNKFKISWGEDIKNIFTLSWPVMLGMILQSLLGTVDTYFINKMGKDAAAAAGLGSSVSGVVFVLSTLVSAGTIALVSRCYGEGDLEKVKKFIGESFMLSAIFGAVLSAVCFLLTTDIIRIAFNPKPQVLKPAVEYLSVILLGTVFVFLNSALRTALQALGDTKTPLYVFGISNIIHGILDYLLMFPMGLGVRGAAIATVIAMVFSFLAINIVLIKRLYSSSIMEFVRNTRTNFKDCIRILRIGGWACIQNVARPITGVLMFSLVLEVGKSEATAAFGIGGQLFNYTFILLVGLSTAISIMVGQSLGRGDLNACDRVIGEGIKLSSLNMLVFAIPYMVIPELIIGVFSSDTSIIRHGAEYLRIVYIGLIFVIYTTTYGGVFQGAGDTFPPMISSLVANVILKLPLAYFLAKIAGMGTTGVWIAVALSVVMEGVIIIVYFKRNKWKEKVI